MSIRNSKTSGAQAQFPGTLSGVSKEFWTSLASRAIKEDQTAVRSANEDGNMRVDVFSDETGIDTGLSSGYTFRGTPNYDVVITAGSLSLFRPSDIPTNLQGFWKLNDVVAHTAHTMTSNGGAKISTAQSQLGGASGFFDGTDDYVAVTGGLTDFNLTGNFTIEGFIYPTANATKEMFNLHVATNNDVSVKLDASGRLQMTMENAGGGSGTLSAVGATTVTTNTWHHFAFVRIGAVVYVYLDGVRDGSGTISGSFPTSGSWNVSIGVHKNDAGSTSNHFQGYIDELRISNGIARYDVNFTPTTTAFTYDGFTVLLGHMDGTNDSTTFTDSSASTTAKDYSTNANHLTPSGSPAQSDQDYWATREPSGDFESGSSQHLAIADGSQTGLDITGVVSFSAFVKIESTGSNKPVLTKWDESLGSQKSYDFGISSAERLYFNVSSNGSSEIQALGATTLSVGKWYHIACVYTGAYILIYVNGNLDNATSYSLGIFSSTSPFWIGRQHRSVSAYQDGLIKDAAIWSSAITASQIKSLALGIDLTSFAYRPSNTSISPVSYWKLNDIDNPHVLQPANGAVISTTQSKFGGSSLSITALPEQVNVVDHDDFYFGTGDFCIETFVRFTSVAGQMGFFTSGQDANNYFTFFWDTSNLNFEVKVSSSITVTISRAWAPTTNTWYHIAVSRSGTSLRLFVDGTQLGATVTTSGDIANYTTGLGIGYGRIAGGGGNIFISGFMDETRISKGVARYTANFTPTATPFTTDANTVLLAHWDGVNNSSSMVDSSRTITDSVGSNHLESARVTRGAGYAEGIGRDFERSNASYLRISDSNQSGLDITSNLTISAWIKLETLPSASAETYTIAAKFNPTTDQRSYILAINTSDVLIFATSGDGTVSTAVQVNGTTALKVGVWYHVAGVFNDTANTLEIFIDGVSNGSTTQNNGIFNSTAPLEIGANTVGTAEVQFFDGLINDVAIWNSALSGASISSLACGIPLQSQGIVSYWKLNEASGTREDAFGNNDLADNNTVGSTTGQVGTAADFERDNTEWLSITDASQSGLDLERDFTLMVWGKGETWPGNQMTLLNKFITNTGWSLQLTSSQKLSVQSDAGAVNGATTVTMGVFHHLAGTFTGAQLEVWLDSYKDGTTASTDSPVATAQNFRMGALTDAGADAWDGLLDEALIATRYFRDEEIKTVYNKGLNGKEATSAELSPANEGTLISTAFTVSEVPTHALVIANTTPGTGTITFYVSRVSSPGTNLADTTKWTEIVENTITDLTKQNSGSSCRWAAVITGDAELDDIAVVFGKANE